MKVAILTDTNSGIPSEEIEKLGIFSMSMPVIIDGESYYENENLTVESYLKALTDKREVTTSQPSPGNLIEQWDKIFELGYDQIVYIPMSSGLSSSYSTAMSFKDEYDNVVVVDNHRVSVTLRASVMNAIKLVEAGKTAEEIRDILESNTNKSVIYLGVDTLEYFMKTGRASSAAASLISNVLNVKPILKCTGEKFEPYSAVRGLNKCASKIISAIETELKTRFADEDKSQIVIGVASSFVDHAEAEKWFETIKKAFPDYHVYYDPLSCSICTHTGPNAMGIGISKIL